MKRSYALLGLILANIAIFILACVLLPDESTSGGSWYSVLPDFFVAKHSLWYIPWVILVCAVLISIAVWNFIFPGDGTRER